MHKLPPDPLATFDVYRTPDKLHRSLLSRILPTSLHYHPRMIWTVFESSSVAKKGLYDNHQWSISSFTMMRQLEESGVQITAEGLHNLTSFEGPAVIAGNHMSVLETFVLPVLITPVKPCTFVVKPSLVEYPVFGPVMRAVDPIVVSRDNPRKDLQIVLEEGKARLAQGKSVILFPQTTRTPQFNPDDFNSLGVKLAKNAGVPIIPLALKTDAWANGKHIKDLGIIDPSKPVHFAFGKPMHVEGNDRQVHQEVVSFIQEMLEKWK